MKSKELDFMTGIHRANLCAVARFLPFVWSEEWAYSEKWSCLKRLAIPGVSEPNSGDSSRIQ